MKSNYYVRSPILLFLLPAIVNVAAESLRTDSSILTPREASPDPGTLIPDLQFLSSSPKAFRRGPPYAPLDGQDGKPHAGPWVETSAERDRKKAKENAESSEASDIKFNSQASSHDYPGPDGKIMPHSNDGATDDPDKLGPKEGTRGSEGMSGNLRNGKQSKERVPDSPKEAPPLPDSERQKVSLPDERVGDKEKGSLGVLEVWISPKRIRANVSSVLFYCLTVMASNGPN